MLGTRQNRRFLSLLMAVVMMITVLPVATVKAATTTIAEWVWNGNYEELATGGDKAGKAELISSADTITSQGAYISETGWDTGEEYWLITVPKAGYENLEIAFECRSSNTGPGDFELQVSTDGDRFETVKKYSVKNAQTNVSASLSNASGVNIDEADVVYIKLAHTSKIAVNGKETAEAGTSRLFFVEITGTQTESGGEETKVSPVTATIPTGSKVEVGASVDFATVTTGCAIYLDVNGKGYRETNTLTLEDEDFEGDPAIATVKAYATKEGLEQSKESIFEYIKNVENPLEVIDITSARQQAVGSKVIVEGTVTKSILSSATNTTNCTVYIQDDTAGIAVYKSGIGIDRYPIGTKVKVEGKISEYNGVQIQPETLEDIQILDVPVAPRVPETITMDQLISLDYEGKLVQLVGVTLDTKATNSNHIIKDDITGKTVTMRWAGDLTLPSEFEEGASIDVVGIAANFKGKAQLLVGKVTDITKGQEAEVAVVTATPAGGSQVPLNQAITLATTTEDAHILYTINDGQEQVTSTNKGEVTIESFDTEGKTTIKAKATNGNYTTPEVNFVYTQAKTEKVIPSVPVGAIDGNSQIGLTTATHDATISYILTTNVGLENEKINEESKYIVPVVLTPELFPVKIEAWATAKNYLDSEKVELNYRLKTAQGEMGNYYGQLHSHTAENSDGQGTLQEGFEWARDKAGLDFFAITDHSNSFDKANTSDKAGTYNLGSYNASNEKWQNGVREAEAARTEDYISVYGYEMTWSGGPGHINTFATEGFVSRNNKELNNKTDNAGLRAYYELLKNTPESISQFNHPGKTFGTFGGYAYYDPIIDERITLIEVGNGEGAVGSNSYFPSYEEYTAALDKGWHLAPTNNQDNHKKGWGTSNTARTVIYTDDLSVDGVYEALRERRVYATEDNNLDIVYTLNDEVLGSILSEVPEQAQFKVATQDPDETDRIKRVEIITNGGKVVHKQSYDGQEVDFEYTLDNPKAGYYYIKVVQADGHIAVTAPIWLGQDVVVGISNVDSSVSMPVTNESLTLTTELFNNENKDVVLKSISYDYKDGNNIATQSFNEVMSSNMTFKHTQSLTPTVIGEHTIVVTAIIEIDGEDVSFKSEFVLNVRDADKLIYVGIDASHYNEYVSGNYKASMGNFGKLAEEYNVRTVELPTSKDLLKALENPKYEMMVFTAPSRRDGTVGRLPYGVYSDEEIEAIAKFAAEGKTVIVAGWSDFYENYTNLADMPADEHMAAQQNKLLEVMGASLRISDDGVKDDVNNGGQPQRLYLTDHNSYVSPLTKGIVEGQVFSHYGGASIHVAGASGTPVTTLPENVLPIVSGHKTTYSEDQDKDSLGGSTVPRYDDSVLLIASETLTHENDMTSEVIVAGAAFMSNFEIQAEIDNNDSKNYSNYNILENIVKTLSPQEITTIAVVKEASAGSKFTIEGIATSSGYNGSESNKGFFDCIYVEDATGGINLFPVSDGVTEGQRIRVTGTVSSYQDEVQLVVSKVEVIDEELHPLKPTKMTTGKSMLKEHTGKLIEVTGIVEEVMVDNGVVNQIMINDGSGSARIFINGYITKDVNLDFVEVGAKITAVGLASVGENFSSETEFLPRLRVRDRGEIKLVSDEDIDQPSDNALLSTLKVSKGILKPEFKEDVFNYEVAVSNSTKEITLEAVTADQKATVEGTGVKVLKVGANTFELVVTAEDSKTTQAYTVVVKREASDSSDEESDDSSLTTKPSELTATQVINNFSSTQKEAIIHQIEKQTPYTNLGGLTIKQLDTLTLGHFTKAQLEEMLGKPEILKGLGVNVDELSYSVTLQAIEEATFSDVPPTHWSNESIQQAARLGLVTGRPDGTFAPSEVLKVADTFTFLDRLLLLHGVTDMKLPRSTVEKYITGTDHWAFASIASVSSKLSEEILKVVAKLDEQDLSRELLAQVIYEVTDGKLERKVEGMYLVDIKQSPYEEALIYCVETGVLKGVGKDKILPQKALTRAELVTVLIRLDELLK